MISLLLDIQWDNLQERIGGEKISSFLWCAGIIVGSLLLKKPLGALLTKICLQIANRFSDQSYGQRFTQLFRKPLETLLQIFLFYIAINQLTNLLNTFVLQRFQQYKSVLAIRLGDVVDHLFILLAILYTTLLLVRLADFIFYVQHHRAIKENNNDREQMLPLIKEITKLLAWIIGIFWILGSVFHVNIPALVTGLGIGGVAIALAAKESVENFFASFTILADKPFRSGDLIKLGTLEGNVVRIGFRSTILRGTDGSTFIIPNKKLVNENLENLSRRDIRRVRLMVNIKYGIDHEALTKAVAEISEMVKKVPQVKKPVEVNLETFNETALQLVVSYYLAHPLEDGSNLNQIKQGIALRTYDIINRYSAPVSIVAEPAALPSNAIQEEETDEHKEESETKEDTI